MKTISATFEHLSDVEQLGTAWQILGMSSAAETTSSGAVICWSDSLRGLARASSRPAPGLAGPAAEFDRLTAAWRAETAGAPFVMTRVMHWAYQRIIGMGSAALPLIFADLERAPDHWFWALTAITGTDAAEGLDDMQSASSAWLGWARQHGYLA